MISPLMSLGIIYRNMGQVLPSAARAQNPITITRTRTRTKKNISLVDTVRLGSLGALWVP